MIAQVLNECCVEMPAKENRGANNEYHLYKGTASYLEPKSICTIDFNKALDAVSILIATNILPGLFPFKVLADTQFKVVQSTKIFT